MDVLETRINGIFENVMSSFHGGDGMSSASKGTEREQFVKEILNQVFPTHFRFTVEIFLTHPSVNRVRWI